MGTNIEWTNETWNPISGCTEVSPGCAHCYAKVFAERFRGVKGHYYENGFDVMLRPQQLAKPLHWKTPRRIFVNSMSDLFHEDVPFEFIDRVFAVMALTPQHTYQVLTKRPQRMREYMSASGLAGRIDDAVGALQEEHYPYAGDSWCLLVQSKTGIDPTRWPLPNVWLGVTVENQHFADERIPVLLDTPAAVRFISTEPLLGPVRLRNIRGRLDALDGTLWERLAAGHPQFLQERGLQHLDWVIVGGESGPRHRPFDPDWARSIVAQCRDAGVACFVKQLGGARPGNKIEDLPPDLKVREFPR